MFNIEIAKKDKPTYNINKLIIRGNRKEIYRIKPRKQNTGKQNIEPEYWQQYNNIMFEIY